MQQNLQQHRLVFGLLLAATVLAAGCRGLRCNLLSDRGSCCQACPYGCTDYSDSACGGCGEEYGEDYHGVMSPPPLPATDGTDVNMPPDVSAKALPKPRQMKPTDVAPPSLRVAKRPRAERRKTKPKRPKILPESAPAKPIHREPTPATKPTAAGPTATKRVSAEQPTTGKFEDFVRPSARYVTVTPGLGAPTQDRASRGAVYTAWYIERTEPLMVQGGPIHDNPTCKSPVHKSLAQSKPAKKIRSTLRFRSASVVTLQATGQSPVLGPVQSSDVVRSSTLASPPPHLQPVRIRSVRR